MDESPLRSLRAQIEAHVEPPDFAAVAARGERIRRHRTVTIATVAALAVATTALVVSRPLESRRSEQPVHQPVPVVDLAAARRVLADPDAQVDTDASRVSADGAMLAVVIAGTPSAASAGPSATCPSSGHRRALRWTGAQGGRRAWIDRPRRVEAVPGGFVLSAVPPACRTDDPADAHAYLVGPDGLPRPVTWGAGARLNCAPHPANPRCHFDATTGRATLEPSVRLPRGATALPGDGRVRWAQSADFRRLWSSTDDGQTWRHHDTSLPAGTIVTASAAGRWGVIAGGSSIEVTSDAGATWRHRNISAALRQVRVGDVDWTVTPQGVLLGVTQLVGRGDVLFRSTDNTWSHFVETDVHTSFGLVRPIVVGGVVYVVDVERWAVSTDGGATWRRTPPLP